jgi:hypothetical protein
MAVSVIVRHRFSCAYSFHRKVTRSPSKAIKRWLLIATRWV